MRSQGTINKLHCFVIIILGRPVSGVENNYSTQHLLLRRLSLQI